MLLKHLNALFMFLKVKGKFLVPKFKFNLRIKYTFLGKPPYTIIRINTVQINMNTGKKQKLETK